ncbi:MAG TPA: EAL domain-containing protein [Rubrobacteraceae bacterium]|nr:EAL domain-containing protein [Rubrobacteraceae bacterium]
MIEDYLRTALEQSPLATLIFRPDGSTLLCNEAWTQLGSFGEDEDPADVNVFENPQIKAAGLLPYIEESIVGGAVNTPPLLYDPTRFGGNGYRRWFRAYVYPLRDADGTLSEVTLMLDDVTEQKALEERLAHQAFHDTLTGLANRTLFADRLEHALTRTERQKSQIALMFIDIDGFKHVNDSLGHSAGDSLLVEIAQRLTACLRPQDTIARFGGDEFTVLLEDVDVGGATEAAERVLREIRRPMTIGAHDDELLVTASIGIVLGRSSKLSVEDLLRRADAAMYRSKEGGKNGYTLFDWHTDELSVTRLRLESDLRRALEREEFRVHYQPKVLLSTERIVGFEALVRWEQPGRGLIPPSEFIPLAEQTGLINPIGLWVIKEACGQIRDWQDQYPLATPLTMSVNLSAWQFRSPNLVEDVSEILDETGLDPGDLVLELTESTAMRDTLSTMSIFSEFKNLGVKLAIDDFGTGYSSISYLKRFPVNVLKVDKSLVNEIELDPANVAIVSAIITLAHGLGLKVVVEGVESPAQFAKLHALEGDFGQGTYWWGASPPEEITQILESELIS